jgi:hypothetical protein
MTLPIIKVLKRKKLRESRPKIMKLAIKNFLSTG